MVSYIAILILSMLLLNVYQGARIAFIYSFRFREKSKEADSLTTKVLYNFYRIPGSFLAYTFFVSFLSLVAGAFAAFQLLYGYTVIGSLGAPGVLLIFLIVMATFMLTGLALPPYVWGRHPDRTLTVLAMPLYLLGVLFIPLTRLVLALPRWILRLCGTDADDKFLATLLGGKELMNPHLRPALSVEEPQLHESDMKIFRNALEFSNVRVRDCIVPRTEIVAVEVEDSTEELMKTFIDSGMSKIIVYQEDLDHIVGYVHSSDMFSPTARAAWTENIRKIPVVPESMSAQKMMQIFMQQKKSIAVVADEFGGTSGIISLEDLVEEIFGDIEDEHDTVTYTARRLSDGEYLLSARLEIEKVNEQFGIGLPESDEYLTVGGFILFHYQDFPKTGQTVNIGQFCFTILKNSTSKIDLVKLKVGT